MKNSKIKVWELSLLIALCVSLCQAAVEAGRVSALGEKIVRLHVIAASDSESDQERKLRVRDAVLRELEGLLSGAESAGEAGERIEAGREDILSAARSAAGEESVELIFGRAGYGYRSGGGYSLPPGEYLSLRLVLGEGAGHNWWGIIFPQLDAAAGSVEAMKLLDEDELAIIYEENGVSVRFRLLELLESLRSRLR